MNDLKRFLKARAYLCDKGQTFGLGLFLVFILALLSAGIMGLWLGQPGFALYFAGAILAATIVVFLWLLNRYDFAVQTILAPPTLITADLDTLRELSLPGTRLMVDVVKFTWQKKGRVQIEGSVNLRGLQGVSGDLWMRFSWVVDENVPLGEIAISIFFPHEGVLKLGTAARAMMPTFGRVAMPVNYFSEEKN